MFYVNKTYEIENQWQEIFHPHDDDGDNLSEIRHRLTRAILSQVILIIYCQSLTNEQKGEQCIIGC